MRNVLFLFLFNVASFAFVPKEIYGIKKAIRKYHGVWNEDLQQEAWYAYFQSNRTVSSILSSCNHFAYQQTKRQKYIKTWNEENLVRDEKRDVSTEKQVEDTPLSIMTRFQWTFSRYQKEKRKYTRRIPPHLRIHKVPHNLLEEEG
jgi:hypothetical protein